MGRPSGEPDHSCERMIAPILPPPARKKGNPSEAFSGMGQKQARMPTFRNVVWAGRSGHVSVTVPVPEGRTSHSARSPSVGERKVLIRTNVCGGAGDWTARQLIRDVRSIPPGTAVRLLDVTCPELGITPERTGSDAHQAADKRIFPGSARGRDRSPRLCPLRCIRRPEAEGQKATRPGRRANHRVSTLPSRSSRAGPSSKADIVSAPRGCAPQVGNDLRANHLGCRQ